MTDAARSTMDEIRDLIATPDLPELDGRPRPGRRSIPELTSPIHRLFSSGRFQPDLQAVLRSAILLWHDHLDASHELSQRIENPDGSFLHGIMHRREGDYGNAAYWFRRAGNHPAYALIPAAIDQDAV